MTEFNWTKWIFSSFRFIAWLLLYEMVFSIYYEWQVDKRNQRIIITDNKLSRNVAGDGLYFVKGSANVAFDTFELRKPTSSLSVKQIDKYT